MPVAPTSTRLLLPLEGLKYDVAKGPQSYRKCDHQSIQSVLVLESKKKADMKSAADLFRITAIEQNGDAVLRSCAELGFRAEQQAVRPRVMPWTPN